MAKKSKRVVWFSEVGKEDVELVGGKGANLGEMVGAGFPVPNGFIVTAVAYYEFIRENNLTTKINHLLKTANFNNADSLMQVSRHVKALIIKETMSDELAKEITAYYRQLGGVLKDALVAVRSSATAEDLPGASFAGQQETYLNVRGEANVILKVKEAWASLFNARAIFYRHEQHFDHFRIGIAIPVQKMVESEQSGIMFTIDPVTNDKSKVVIEAIYGLGEMIVQGIVTPDHYEVSKHDKKIIAKQITLQTKQLVKKGAVNKEEAVPKRLGEKQKITDEQILSLSEIGKKLEKHYYFPQDSEWAIEKETIYIVQTRPVTTTGEKKSKISKEAAAGIRHGHILLKGDPASPGIATGPVIIVHSAKEIDKVQTGDVLVAPQTNPDFVPAMKKVKAIVTDSGGRTSHAAIISRELGIPAVVGTKDATKRLKNGEIVTVHGIKGEVFRGGFDFSEHRHTTHLNKPLIQTKTHVYVNLAEPELAKDIAQNHVDGVGLLRAEFMMAGIGVHPKKMIRDGKRHVFIEKLARNLEMFCEAFHPRPVVYRASDFKSNEYRNLVGGKDFEPIEPNPMLGFRGAFRYIHDPNVFQLELEAIKEVRNNKGYKNLWMMIPFVRSVQELAAVKKHITASGLHRSEQFKLWMMVEIPVNVILLDQFIHVGIDGISIGSNDLTMLLLGTDRDNSEVAPAYNEQNPAVLWALEHIIKTAKQYHITASICGQAPSQYPSLVEKLVEWGITSVSVSPDVIYTTREMIATVEKKLKAS